MLLAAGPLAAEAQSTPGALADAYLQAILDDDWATTRELWCETDRREADRLGIRYAGDPFKLDNASALVRERAACRSGAVTVAAEIVAAHSATARIRYRLHAGPESVVVEYRAVAVDDAWRLIKPVTDVAMGWPRRRTEFLELRVQPGRSISPTALANLDAFVAETCTRLDVSPDRMARLREVKLAYVLGDPQTVTEIVGVPAAGVALLQTDTVVTSEPCHLHELAHLLINYALEDPPLYTVPVLQEGAAVALGGRWGHAPAVMGALGRFALTEGFVSMESLLTWDGFHAESADLTYAPSGLWADALLSRLGGAGFLALYRELSGSFEGVRGFDRATVVAHVERATGVSWNDLTTDFETMLEAAACGGIMATGQNVGDLTSRVEDDGLVVEIRRIDTRYRLDIEAMAPVSGALVFRGDDGNAESRLFGEQFSGRARNGAILAVVFSPDEIGVYDFRVDLLTAKYVAGFCPDLPVVSEDGRRLSFTVGIETLPAEPWDLVLLPGRN